MRRINFYIRKPNGKSVNFSIYKRIENSDGSTSNENIELKEIAAINSQYHASVIDITTALNNLNKIKINLLRNEGIDTPTHAFNLDNEKVLDHYWEQEYANRDLIDPSSARFKLERAIRAVGNISLLSGTRKQIEDAINENKFPNNKQREIANKLNCLLKFIGRTDIKINRKKKERKPVKYLTESEVLQIATQMGDPALEVMIKIAFFSGLRMGELFALKKSSLFGTALKVISQIDKDGVERDPKWGSKRTTFLFPGGEKPFEEWIQLKDSITLTRVGISKRFKTACKRFFKENAKHCKFHDLRHSYAINLLKHEVNLTLVAQSLGNSVVVAQEYYADFTLNDETIETISRRVKISLQI